MCMCIILIFYCTFFYNYFHIVEYNLGLSKGDRNGEATLLVRSLTVRRGSTVIIIPP